MPEGIELAVYQEILACEGIGAIVWNLETDEIIQDTTLEKILATPLQTEHFSQVLLNRARVHPNDYKLLVDLVAFLSRRHKEYHDNQCTMAFEYRIMGEDGQYQWYHLRQIVYFKGDRPYRAVGALRNTDEERRRQEELQAQAERDPMTGLYNKKRVRELIEEALQVPNTENALLVLDLDGFKQVNDQLGHMTGDAVISDMALSLQTVFRQTDILGRIGGDEFVVLLRDTVGDTAFIVERCIQLRDLLRKCFKKDGQELHVTGSIGIALAPKDGRTYAELFSCADAALYKAKEEGRDTQIFYESSFSACSPEHKKQSIACIQEKAFLEKPVEYIFQMLYETKDAKLTVELLLELFAKYFHVHRVYIYHMLDENYWSKCIFEWRAKGVSSSDEAHYGEVGRIIERNYRHSEYGYFSECHDTAELEPEGADLLQSRKIQAFLHCGILDGGRFLGCVGFDDAYHARIWTRKEHEVLKTFADIMGSFLLNQSRVNTLQDGNHHLRLILDTMESYVWVIRQDTHDVLYMNTAAFHVFGRQSQILAKCYQTFQNRQELCAECPFSAKEKAPRVFSVWNEKLQCNFHGKVFSVEWDAGVMVWLVFTDR